VVGGYQLLYEKSTIFFATSYIVAELFLTRIILRTLLLKEIFEGRNYYCNSPKLDLHRFHELAEPPVGGDFKLNIRF